MTKAEFFKIKIVNKLPSDYLITRDDLKMLTDAGKFVDLTPKQILDDELTPRLATKAVNDLIMNKGTDHPDPFELLLDSGMYI